MRAGSESRRAALGAYPRFAAWPPDPQGAATLTAGRSRMRTALLALPLLVLGAAESSAPRLLSGPSIPYPNDARLVRVAGDAVFVASVDEKGAVTGVEVRAVPLPGLGFEEAIQKAVMKWRFQPAELDGQPRPGRHEGRFSFVLRAKDEGVIAEKVTRLAEAWNGSDAAGFAATFEPDEGQVNTPSGPGAKGKAAIQSWAAQRFTAQRPQLATRPAGLHFYEGSMVTAWVPIEGLHRPMYMTLVSRKGGWLVRSLDDTAMAGVGALRPLLHVGDSGVPEPRKIRNIAPDYPLEALAMGIQGTVVLECVVTELGEVIDVRTVSGPPLLRAPAAAAVKGWRYTPVVVDGRPVPVAMTITVSFRGQ